MVRLQQIAVGGLRVQAEEPIHTKRRRADVCLEHLPKRISRPVANLKRGRRTEAAAQLLREVEETEPLRHLNMRKPAGPEDAPAFGGGRRDIGLGEVLQHAVGVHDVEETVGKRQIACVRDNECRADAAGPCDAARRADRRQVGIDADDAPAFAGSADTPPSPVAADVEEDRTRRRIDRYCRNRITRNAADEVGVQVAVGGPDSLLNLRINAIRRFDLFHSFGGVLERARGGPVRLVDVVQHQHRDAVGRQVVLVTVRTGQAALGSAQRPTTARADEVREEPAVEIEWVDRHAQGGATVRVIGRFAAIFGDRTLGERPPHDPSALRRLRELLIVGRRPVDRRDRPIVQP